MAKIEISTTQLDKLKPIHPAHFIKDFSHLDKMEYDRRYNAWRLLKRKLAKA